MSKWQMIIGVLETSRILSTPGRLPGIDLILNARAKHSRSLLNDALMRLSGV